MLTSGKQIFILRKDFFSTSAALHLQESTSLLLLLGICMEGFNTVPKGQIFFGGGVCDGTVIYFPGKNEQCEWNSAKLADQEKLFFSGHKKIDGTQTNS